MFFRNVLPAEIFCKKSNIVVQIAFGFSVYTNMMRSFLVYTNMTFHLNFTVLTKLVCVYCRCPHESIKDTNCSTENVLITEKCNCKSDCEIEASNTVFGDPCENTFKYVNITYICLRVDGK